MYTLYSYFRSSASWRVRLALTHKEIPFTYQGVNLLKGEHRDPTHLTRNGLGAVPVLAVPRADGSVFLLAESMAILHWLEETHPAPALLPLKSEARAVVRWMCELVNAGIHPLQNLSPLRELESRFGADAAAKKSWAQHFIHRGFVALEGLLREHAGDCCLGNVLSWADLFLVPQVFNARRFDVDLAPFPTITRLNQSLLALPLFHVTHPDRQPDTPPPNA